MYVVENRIARERTVDIKYKGNGYVIINGNLSDYDQIIITKIPEKLNNQKISEITLFDIIKAPYPNNTNIPIQSKSGDISDIDVSKNLISSKPDIIFHLAAQSGGEGAYDNPKKDFHMNFDKDPTRPTKEIKSVKKSNIS